MVTIYKNIHWTHTVSLWLSMVSWINRKPDRIATGKLHFYIGLFWLSLQECNHRDGCKFEAKVYWLPAWLTVQPWRWKQYILRSRATPRYIPTHSNGCQNLTPDQLFFLNFSIFRTFTDALLRSEPEAHANGFWCIPALRRAAACPLFAYLCTTDEETNINMQKQNYNYETGHILIKFLLTQ